jgi:hypothetical protein
MDPSSSRRRHRRRCCWIPPPPDLAVIGVVRAAPSVVWRTSLRRSVACITAWRGEGDEGEGEKAAAMRGESGGATV